MQSAASPTSLIAGAGPDEPVFCFREAALRRAAGWFDARFPGKVFYAVKANPAPHILTTLWQAGLRAFDTASMAEIECVGGLLPGAEMAFLHPVKNRRAIARAYHEFGVRAFVLDSMDELEKILDATGRARDLTLIVRVHVSNAGASVPLTGKFGASCDAAPGLMRAARAVALGLGVSFHVGSQSMNPAAWQTAMADLSRLIVAAGVTVDIVDVGGGFPSVYIGTGPVSLDDYVDRIVAAFADMKVLASAELWCEPGRALVAEAESLLVRIEGTKPGALYLNDGSFGALYDVVHERWQFPMRAIGKGGVIEGERVPYTVYGPTCDSADRFPETVLLPAGLAEGDCIEFGNIGAYGRALSGRFNGFGRHETLAVADDPWPSLYRAAAAADSLTSLTGSTR